MDRTSAPGHVNRRFVSEDAAINRPPTELVPTDFNAWQEELMAIIEAAGIVPNAANNAQVLAALQLLYFNKTTADSRFAPLTAIGYRNRIVNGDMSVSQINGSAAVTPAAASSWPIDQWLLTASQASKITVQQVADAPPGLKYSTKLTVAATAAPAAGDVFSFSQQVEGQNVIDFSLGFAAAATISISFWVKGTIAGNYGVRIANYSAGASNRNYLTTIPVTTVWTKQTVVFPGDISGIWATDNASGIQVAFDLGVGTTYQSAALNAWQNGNFLGTAASVKLVSQTVGSTLNITGVQLEKVATGATFGTEFEFLPYADQERRCQRYLPCFTSGGIQHNLCSAYGSSATGAFGILVFPVPCRVAPTALVISSPGHVNFVSAIQHVATAVALGSTTPNVAQINVTSSGMPISSGGQLWFNTVGAKMYFTGAQL